MTDIMLDILDEKSAVLRVTYAETDEVEFIPVVITASTPIKGTPLLGEVKGNYIPQELLDTLFRMRLQNSEERWWQDYFITRREDQKKYLHEIAMNDALFAENPEVSWTI